jgi:hypothetical protein
MLAAMSRLAFPSVLAASVTALVACGCNALLDIDEVVFADGPTGGGYGGTSAGGSSGGSAGAGGSGGTAGSGGSGTAGTGGTAGAGGSGGAGGAVLGAWGTPQLVHEISDISADDDDPTFTADLLELYFNSDRVTAGISDIYVSTRNSPTAPWGTPQAVVELNSTADDTNMALAPDGLTMWFGSERSSANLEIYVSSRPNRSSSWSSPTIVPELNSPNADVPCAVTADLLTLIIAARTAGVWNLYQATRSSATAAWSTPVAIAELNSGASEVATWLSADGLHVYFDSERDGGPPDIYRSTRASLLSPFASPTAVTELNTAVDESDPWLSPDERYIMFVVGPGDRQIYEAFR